MTEQQHTRIRAIRVNHRMKVPTNRYWEFATILLLLVAASAWTSDFRHFGLDPSDQYRPSLTLSVCAQSYSSYITVLVDELTCQAALGLLVESDGSTLVGCATGLIRVDPNGALNWLVNDTDCKDVSIIIRHPTTGILYLACEPQGIVYLDNSGVVQPLINDSQCGSALSAIGTLLPSDQFMFVGCMLSGVVRIDLNASTPTNPVYTTVLDVNQCSNPAGLVRYIENSVEYLIAGCDQGDVILLNLSTGDITSLLSSNICAHPSGIMRDSESGVVYISCLDQGILRVEGTSVTTMASVDQCGYARDVLHDARHMITYGLCSSGDVIAISDTSIVPIIPYSECAAAHAIQIVDGGIILSCYGSGAVRVSTSTMSSVAAFGTCQNAQSISLDQNTGVSYVTCSNGLLSFVNNMVTRVASEAECSNAFSVWKNPNQDQIIAACVEPGLIKMNTTTREISLLIPTDTSSNICKSVLGFFEDQSTGLLYVACDGSGIIAYNLLTGNVTQVVDDADCDVAYGFAKNYETNRMFIGCSYQGVKQLSSDGTVVTLADGTICTEANSVVTTGELVYATCGGAFFASVIMINVTSGNITVLATTDKCARAFGMTLSVATGLLIIACEGTGVVTIDTHNYEISTVLTASQCSTALSADQDHATQTIYIACLSKGILAASTDFKCLPGTAWNLGSCMPCLPSTYRGSRNLNPLGQCLPCERGFVSSKTGLTECSPCPSGTYESENLCLLCPAGKFQAEMNATSCIDCPPGAYSFVPGRTICTSCETGSYAATNGSVSCLPCTSGSASAIVGLTHACDGCPAGFYQASLGQTSCLPCPAHFYSEQANSTSCTRCANQVNEDRTACSVVTCDANSQFNEITNQCERCPLTQYSSRGGLCTTCVINTYTPAVGSGCAPCDDIEGLECSGGIAIAKPGFWAFLDENSVWSDSNVPNATSYQRYQTSPCPFCSGSQLQIDTDRTNTSMSTMATCTFPRLNSINNTLCARCEPGYLPWGESCVECNQANSGLIFGYIVLSFAIVLFLLYSVSSTSSAASTSIFLFFIQTAALELGSITQWLDWIHVSNLDPKSSASCLAPWSEYDQTLFALLIPIILFAELMAIAAVHYLLHCLLRSSSYGSSFDQANPNTTGIVNIIVSRILRFSFNDYRAGATSILLFCYTQVTTATLRYLYCVKVGKDHLNFNAPTINCKSSQYAHYLVPVLLSLIVYVIGFPFIAFGMLWRHKDSLYLPASSDVLKSSPAVASFLLHWAPFYQMYHPRAYPWQCWVLLRRAAFVVVAVVLVQQSDQRFMAFGLLNFTSLLLHLWVCPYESNILNRMETVSYVLLVAISEFLQGYDPPYPLAIQVLLFFLVVPPAAGMLLVIIVQRYRQWQLRASSKKSQEASNAVAMSTVISSGIAQSDTAADMEVEMPVITASSTTQAILPDNLDSEQL